MQINYSKLRNPFIGIGRNIHKSNNISDEEYKTSVNEISNMLVDNPDIKEPQEIISPVKKNEEISVKDWTLDYRAERPVEQTTQATVKTGVRSDRNNNPLNIRYNLNINWEGKVNSQDRTDDAFEEFISRDYGWRAAYRNLNTKMRRGVNTIRKLISEWAPPTENNTILYINDVSTMTGIDPDAIIALDDRELIPKLGAAMAAIEANRKNQINWQDALNGFEFYLNSNKNLTT